MRNRRVRADIFAEESLVILVSIVTLLLQLISFATTWSGSRIYLEGVFPYASLLFAAAIQATAYFFSNSLRNRTSVLKVAVLLIALGCSTYYSYIGIYHSVNSPITYLQESYLRVQNDLTLKYHTALEENLAGAGEAVNDASSLVIARYAALAGERGRIESCFAALEGERESHAQSMRAPKLSSYENYEDYAEAYRAYLAAISVGGNTEDEAFRSNTLAAYGFASVNELEAAKQENYANLSALAAVLNLSLTGDTDSSFTAHVSDMSVKIISAIDGSAWGEDFDSEDDIALNRLFQAARLCGYQGMDVAEVTDIVGRAAEASKKSLLDDYDTLVEGLEKGRATSANLMELKGMMDSEILTAQITLNSLFAPEKQISFSDEQYLITDLYLIPIQAFRDSATRMTAVFCLGVAALVDLLSLLFAISLRKRKPLWKRRSLLFVGPEDYIPQIYAALPTVYVQESGMRTTVASAQMLAEFIACFLPSPETEGDGYMMQMKRRDLGSYEALAAVLCQLNLAKLVPAGFLGNEEELLLLKARFVFWANSVIYESKEVAG